MICKKCNKENLLKANYCQHCGNRFTQQDKDDAYNGTIFGKFEKLEGYAAYFKPLEIITGSRVFRIATIAVLLLYSVFVSMSGGDNLRMVDGKDYDVMFNTENRAYYVVSEEYYVDAEVYLPRDTLGVTVSTIDMYGQTVDVSFYEPKDSIVLEAGNGNHYLIEAAGKKNREVIEVYTLMDCN